MAINKKIIYNNGYGLPEGLVQLVIETVPDYVCIGVEVKGEDIHPYTLRIVTELLREAWCYARYHGYANIIAGGEDGLSFRISKGYATVKSNEVLVATINNRNNYGHYENYWDTTLIGVRKNDIFWNQSILTPEVEEAYCLYKSAIEDLGLRVKHSIQTMLSLLGDDEEGEEGILNSEVMKNLDAQYAVNRRMYAPDGSKMTGVTASVEGLTEAAETFWIHLARASKTPLWMIGKESANSSFTAEERERDQVRLWHAYCEIPYYKILRYLGAKETTILAPPNYRDEAYQINNLDVQASIQQRKAAAEKMEVSKVVELHKLDEGVYDSKESDRTRDDLTKDDPTEIEPTRGSTK